MKKNIRPILLFLLTLLVIVCAIQWSIDYCYKKRVSNKFTKVFRHEIDEDVMIFGSSVAFHQFDPKIIKDVTGLSAYNMGFPGMFFAQYNGLMKEYLEYRKQCKAIVIACDFDNLGKNELATRPDLFYAYVNYDNVYRSLYEMEPHKAFCARYLPGYKLTLLNKAFYTDMLIGRRYPDGYNGFEALDSKWEVTKREHFNSRYDESVFLKLKETTGEINRKGIKVIFVIPPVYEEGYKLILNAENIKSKYRSLVGKDIYYLDYTNDTLCRSANYFRNFTHLNSRGATAFSNTFAHDLSKIIHE